MIFEDRQDAGKQLAQKLLEKFNRLMKGLVLALPRGGVVVGFEVAKALNLPFDIIVTRKIGAPLNPEYAVAAVSEHELIVSPRENPDPEYLREEVRKERREIQRRLREYRDSKPEIDLKDKTVILVDDGLATGLTMEVAIREVRRQKPAKIILAVPVAPPETIEKLRPFIDELVVLNMEPMFFAVGQFYKNFPQTTDEEVKELLQ
jgi:predicted phosphoribosyltransferase